MLSLPTALRVAAHVPNADTELSVSLNHSEWEAIRVCLATLIDNSCSEAEQKCLSFLEAKLSTQLPTKTKLLPRVR